MMKMKLVFRPDLFRSIGVVFLYAVFYGMPNMANVISTGVSSFLCGAVVVIAWSIITKSNPNDASAIGVLCFSVIFFCSLTLGWWVVSGFSDIKYKVGYVALFWLMTVIPLLTVEIRTTKKSSRKSEMTMDAPGV